MSDTLYHRIVKIEPITKADGTIVADTHVCSCGETGDKSEIVEHINDKNGE